MAREMTRTGNPRTVIIVGGAGFIGSHFVDRFLADSDVEKVTVYDNFSSGHDWHLESHRHDARLSITRGDVRDVELLTSTVSGHSTVIHLASNPDIAAAVTNPAIDFDQGTLLTHSVAEAVRRSGVETILYASGSGVYGELGEIEAHEDFGPLIPVSTYAASKLAGEALLSAYAHMFGFRAIAFRFGNVVGPRQTHGVGFDFIRRLTANSQELSILGDGKQSKSYVHVSDVINGVMLAFQTVERPFDVFNIATLDYITVTEIAEIACSVLGLPLNGVEFKYTGGDRGWKGDVPVVRLSSSKIRALGWANSHNCASAIRESLMSMMSETRLLQN